MFLTIGAFGEKNDIIFLSLDRKEPLLGSIISSMMWEFKPEVLATIPKIKAILTVDLNNQPNLVLAGWFAALDDPNPEMSAICVLDKFASLM